MSAIVVYPETDQDLDNWLTFLYTSSKPLTYIVLNYSDNTTFEHHRILLEEGGYHFHLPQKDYDWEHYTITVEK